MTEPNVPRLRLGTRKVFKSGGGKGTPVISIPKVWRDSCGIKVGDMVIVEICPEGLMIRPTPSKPKF